jgi:predicted esterase YcpF (UPF0227 family)
LRIDVKSNVLIYLHGFNSSPNSVKASQMREFLVRHYPEITLVMPQIALTPAAAWQQLTAITEQYQDQHIGFVGSSLGGFFSTLLSNQYGGKAVLVNPAVQPHLIGDVIVGQHTHPETGEVYDVGPVQIAELAALDWEKLSQASDYWVLLQQGDETLDYRLALNAYEGARITLEPAGDHGFVGFDRYLNAIVEFLFQK